MAFVNDGPGSDDDERDSSEGTHDPNRLGVWPTYPPGTRLPNRKVGKWADRFGLAIILLMLGGGGVFVWWFITALRSR